ncbi:ribosome maturation factor RimP [Hyphobacterium sp.]|uniref:ribosome maturation factor RimP n=1 Tax=Hyphobacterium sp. TaxID=2004662 RepID=UPI003BAA138B
MRTRTAQDDALYALAAPVAEAMDMEIVRIRVKSGKRQTVQIMAEKSEGTMDVEDCAKLSRALSDILEEQDPIRGEYNLEISSPGIDRPLTAPAHFERWAGFKARLELDRLVEGRKKFTGQLAGFEDNSVLIDLPNEKETALIPFDWIADAKLVLTDELMKADLAAREASTDNDNSSGDTP